MSDITQWMLNNIANRSRNKELSVVIHKGENIIQKIAKEAGEASYEIVADDGKVIIVTLYYTGGIATGRYAYHGSEPDPEYKALRKAAECIPGVVFETKERLIFHSPDGDDSWMEPWERDPAEGQEEEAYRSAEKHWEEVKAKREKAALEAKMNPPMQNGQSAPQQQEQPLPVAPQPQEQMQQQDEPIADTMNDPMEEYKKLGIQFDGEGYPIITTAEQLEAYEGDIPFENLKIPQQELVKIFKTEKVQKSYTNGVHTKAWLEMKAENDRKAQEAAQNQKPDPFWESMAKHDAANAAKQPSIEERERAEKQAHEQKVQETRAQKQAAGQPIGGMPEPPAEIGNKYGGQPTASGFTQAQIDAIKAFQKKMKCDKDPALFDKYVNAWNPKMRGKQDLTPENATEFCQWCELMGEFPG